MIQPQTGRAISPGRGMAPNQVINRRQGEVSDNISVETADFGFNFLAQMTMTSKLSSSVRPSTELTDPEAEQITQQSGERDI